MTMSVAASFDDVAAPRSVGPYMVLYEIGRGGMGVVYRAVRHDGGAEVALKTPYAEMADHFGCMRREIHALSRLRHPGVVNIIEEGVERGVPWYAMELLDSRSLDELLGISKFQHEMTNIVAPFEPHSGIIMLPGNVRARGFVRPDLKRALTMMYRLARVLAYVHAHGIVHRDLKPHNVLVRPGDRPVLVDFGLMGQFRAQSGREVLEIGGMMMGTAVYAAPEQASGELVDARADLYAFGCMLYEIVTGTPPFNGSSIHEVLMMHLGTPPVRPALVVNGVPPVLDQLIMQLLEKKRGDRLGYAEDVAALLVEAGAEPDPDFEIETAAYLYRPEIIGRQGTIDSLRALLPAIRDNEGAFVALGGESGIGKTSVAAAFARDAMIGGLNVITGECIPFTTTGDAIGGQPLHPFKPLLRAIADYCLAHGQPAIDRVLGPRLAALREQEPSLDALAKDDAHLPAELISRRLFDDLSTTLAAFANERPLLLILDDLQWADEMTLRFLTSLTADFFHGLPLMILGTYRAEEVGPDLRTMLAAKYIMRVPIGRLDDNSVADIVRSMLAAPNASEDFLAFLAQRSEGNPFFVAEYLRAALAEGFLFREQGRWRIEGEQEASYSSIDLPGTLRDLVGRRIDGRSSIAQRVAEAAAVLGREMRESLLIATAGEREEDAMEAISELLEHYVFDPLDDGVRFAHDKLREAAYERIPPERRRVLHARAANVIENDCTTDELLASHAGELAHHWDIAGNDVKALRYYAIAGERAARTGACREAADLVSRAIAIDERLPGDSELADDRRVRRAQWERLLSIAYFGLGDLTSAAEHARRGMGFVGVRLPRTSAGWGTRLMYEMGRQAAHVMLPRSAFLARDARVPQLYEVTHSAIRYSERCYFTNDTVQMFASVLMAVNTAERIGETPNIVQAYSTLGLISSGMGLHRLADRYFGKGWQMGHAIDDSDGLAHLGVAWAVRYITVCDWKRAETLVGETLDYARRAGDHQNTEIAETIRGHYEFYTGQLAAAAETYASLRDAAHRRANFQHEAWGLFGRARSLILMGRLEESLEHLTIARRLLENQADQLTEVCFRAHEAHTLLHMGALERAAELADETYAIASRTTPPLWEMFRGFFVPAEIYLEVWSRARHNDPLEAERMRRAVKALVRQLRVFALRAPIVLPTAYRIEGVAECLKGNLRRGEKLLRKSVAAAARLGLPIDEGIGEYELVRHTVLDPRERAARRERARTIFREIGADLYLQKMREDPRRSSDGHAAAFGG
jgi:eukaryotic-like serine/threonine-protein kinase